ncbi:DUF1254 domain-containing protein [Pseudomonas putida]
MEKCNKPPLMHALVRPVGVWLTSTLLVSALMAAQANAQSSLSAEETRAIVKEAAIYGFPLVDNYRILYSYFVDRNNPEFKAPWNTLNNTARVYTPDDKAIQSPNSDTPYSQLGADLRAEPLVLTMPAMEKNRFYHAQFIDLYTHNFAYIGTRATGNGAGKFLLAGPNWKGEKPQGIQEVIRSESELAFVLYRTQLFKPADIDKVKQVQAGYKVETLSQYLGAPAPAAAPSIDFMKPLSAQEERTSPEFFNELNFVLQFCPPHPSEKELMARFARLGIGAGKKFDVQALSSQEREAVAQGMAEAWQAYAGVQKKLATGEVISGEVFGTREHLKNNYLYRMAAAAGGIYGNSREEAVYSTYYNDSTGQKLDASSQRYVLRFAPGQLPPVNAFWSLTLYEMPSRLLSANPLDRYLINSAMLPDLKRDADGGLTLYIQHESPGKDKESNWLPAGKGPIWVAFRLYLPKLEAMNGTWKKPAMQRVD